MNMTRILPDLQCALVCEDVRQEVTGNFILLGVTAFLRVPQVPIVASRLCVFTRWCAGVGNFTETVRLIAPDQTTLVRETREDSWVPDAPDQADRRWRPLARRDCSTARPARVLMR